MSRVRKHRGPYVVRRGLLTAVAAVGAWSLGVGAAPMAFAAQDVRSKQWYLDAMGVEDVWKVTEGAGIKVAVVDSGVNPSTSSLKGQVLKGMDATGAPGGATDDYDGHGTTMAELIAGTGRGGGLQGLAPKAKIIPFRIADKNLAKRHKVDPWDNAVAIRAAANSDARIISMSFGNEFMDIKEQAAVKYAESKGKLLFASVGNTGDKENKAEYPAKYPEVAGVAASAPEGRTADYSQHGEIVDLAAPGNDIPRWCDTAFTGYCDGDGGTSAATAIASATAALIWSKNPDWTANQVLRVMFESAGKGKDGKKKTLSNFYGHGVVRPGAHLVRGLGKPGDPDVSPLTNKRTGGGSASSESAGAKAPGGADPAAAAEKGAGAEKAEKAAQGEKRNGGGGWIGYVVVGVVAVGAVGAGAFFVSRRRPGA